MPGAAPVWILGPGTLSESYGSWPESGIPRPVCDPLRRMVGTQNHCSHQSIGNLHPFHIQARRLQRSTAAGTAIPVPVPRPRIQGAHCRLPAAGHPSVYGWRREQDLCSRPLTLRAPRRRSLHGVSGLELEPTGVTHIVIAWHRTSRWEHRDQNRPVRTTTLSGPVAYTARARIFGFSPAPGPG